MSLNELNENLYSGGEEKNSLHVHEKSQYDPVQGNVPYSPFDEKVEWDRKKKELNPFQKRVLLISLAALVLIILAVSGFVFYTWWQKDAFHQDRVSISFEGPKEADSTQIVKYIIHYKNDNRVTLKNSEIQLTYAENFQPVDNVNVKYINASTSRIFVGDVKPKSEGSIEVKGIFYAPKDFPVYLHSEIHFVPSNGAVELAMDAQTSVNITTSPVILDVSAPAQAVDGDSVEYVIDYKNLDLRRLSNVQISVEFPTGFQMTDSQPEPSQNKSSWIIGEIDSNQGGKIRIRGSLHGSNEENKVISVSMGKAGENEQFAIYNKREAKTSIVLPILAVKQELEGSTSNVVKAGDELRYIVSYRNTSSGGLRNAILTVEIQGSVLDFSNIEAGNGFFDGGKKMITWKASELPALANINPGEGGIFRFSVPIKAIIPVSNKNDKNFTVTTIAKIDSPDIPTPIDANKIIGSNTLELRLASKVLLETKGFYKDAQLQNSGPLPIQVGKETTFALHWSLANVSNDLTDAKVVSSLPSGVRWTGVTYPQSEYLTYDARTNQITWTIGNMPAGTGIISAPKEVDFQIGVTPQINNLGEYIKLLNKTTFTGKDAFSGKDIVVEGNEKDTQLREDAMVGFEGGKVVK